MRAPALALLLCVVAPGCASTPTPEEGERLARALARTIRLHYEVRLAGMQPGEQPGPGELRAAREGLDEALHAAGARPLGSEQGSDPGAIEDTVAVARNTLIQSGYVFLPTAGGSEPGLALAYVLERKKGLKRSLWGETVRYRRLVHDAPLVPSFAAYAALRSGRAALAPLGRTAGPTVYLDRQAIARRAGRGEYADVTPGDLSELVELTQAAIMKLGQRVPIEELLVPADASRALEDLHTRVLLTTLRYGELGPALVRLRVVATPSPGRPPELVAAALRVRAAIAGLSPREPVVFRRRVEEIYAALPDGD